MPASIWALAPLLPDNSRDRSVLPSPAAHSRAGPQPQLLPPDPGTQVGSLSSHLAGVRAAVRVPGAPYLNLVPT